MRAGVGFQVRPAVLADHRQLANLIHFSVYVHRHLDWRHPLDWIGASPFYVVEDKGQILAALACPPDPPLIAWVRLFLNSGKIPLLESWQMLWEWVHLELSQNKRIMVAAIVLQDWFLELLIASGLTSRQSIVMLEREDEKIIGVDLPPGFSVRSMQKRDLPVVADVDSVAFDPLWQNSLEALELAYPQAIFPTVVETSDQVVGYQLSTRNPLGVHLARLAVRPTVQGKGIGRALVADLIRQTERHGISHLTVNTQSDNTTSLKLYNNIGFRMTGERYPVYQLPAR
jgi:ribosomal-protein-alanine N-acetyltransferase